MIKPSVNVSLKDFWFTKLNLSHIYSNLKSTYSKPYEFMLLTLPRRRAMWNCRKMICITILLIPNQHFSKYINVHINIKLSWWILLSTLHIISIFPFGLIVGSKLVKKKILVYFLLDQQKLSKTIVFNVESIK